MQKRGPALLRTLATVAVTALLALPLPASVATAADRAPACKVHNLNQNTNRDSLQRAVWDAEPGDALLVQGTCRGTTLVRKDLDISYLGWAGAPLPLGPQYLPQPRGRIVSGSWRPALVIDPRVDDFRINPGLRVSGGIVIGNVRAWQGDARPVPGAWKSASPSLIVSLPSERLRDCHVRNDATGLESARSQVVVASATEGEGLSLRGTCPGTTEISQDLSIAGWRIALSGADFGRGGRATVPSRDDSGPATLARVAVDDDVDSLVLKRVRVTDGFSISDLSAAD